MKKCPYCKTLMNDDVNTCPNCLKDLSSLKPMDNVAPKENQFSFYTFVFGIIIAVGSVLASLSQAVNRKNYQLQYDETVRMYNSASGTDKESYYEKGQELMANIKTCHYKEITFYILCGIGAAMVIYAIVMYFIKKSKNKKKEL